MIRDDEQMSIDEEKDDEKLSLEEVVVALQKSFSRVSYLSAEVDPEAARALVTGMVHFELSLKVQPAKDYLYVDNKGEISLSLSGDLETDIRTVDRKKAPSGSTEAEAGSGKQ